MTSSCLSRALNQAPDLGIFCILVPSSPKALELQGLHQSTAREKTMG